MRIGELLIKDGAITSSQLEAALRMQRQYGGRLASTLVDLGYLDIDVAARALGRLLGVPAALKKHFDAVESRAIERVSRKAAEAYACIPLGFSLKQSKTIVVAFADPKRFDAVQEVQLVVGMRVLAAVAPEVRIERALQQFYGVAPRRRHDFVRVDPRDTPIEIDDPISAPPLQAPALARVSTGPGAVITHAPIELTLDPPPSSGSSRPGAAQSLPPLVADPADVPTSSPPDPRIVPPLDAPAPPTSVGFGPVRDTAASSPHAIRTREAGATSSAPPAAPAPIPAPAAGVPAKAKSPPAPAQTEAERVDRRSPTHPERPAARTSVSPSSPPTSASTRSRALLAAPNAIGALHVASTRDEVGDIIVDHMRTSFGVGIVFITRNDVAVGWKGFAPAVAGHGIEALAVPLTLPSMLSLAYESHQTFRGIPPAEGDEAHGRLWKALRMSPPQESVVVPIVVADRTVNLVYAHAIDGAPLGSDSVRDMLTVCGAATQAYVRLLRNSRPRM